MEVNQTVNQQAGQPFSQIPRSSQPPSELQLRRFGGGVGLDLSVGCVL